MPSYPAHSPRTDPIAPRRRSRPRHLAVLPTLLLLLLAARSALAGPDLYRAVLPDLREEVRAATAGALSTYALSVTLDPAAGTIGGRARIEFVNQTEVPLSEIFFRLYPNADYYGEGGLIVERVRVAGEPVEADLQVEDTVLRVPLADPLPPAAAIALDLRFTTVVPRDSTGTFGIFSRDGTTGTWALADWYPILAGFEADRGWRIEAPTPLGDPTFSEAALYDVNLTAPADLTVAATGTAVAVEETGATVRRRFVSGPAREFTLVVDNDYTTAIEESGGTTVVARANPGNEDVARFAAGVAAEVLAAYGARYGPYPYDELELVDVRLAGAVGVSWSGVVFLDFGRLADRSPRAVFVLAHEIGHQWWGATVGANSNDHAFMVEGLTNYLAVVGLEELLGAEAAREVLRRQMADPYLAALGRHGDGVADTPITAEHAGPPRGALDYGKAALGFLAIRQAVGDEAFFAALRAYADQFAFAIAEPTDLRAAFEAAAGQDLAPLWRFWFEAAETTPADVEALLAGA